MNLMCSLVVFDRRMIAFVVFLLFPSFTSVGLPIPPFDQRFNVG